MTRLSLIVVVAFNLTSCCTNDDKDFNFDNNEPRHLMCYHVHDTIYFQDTNNDLDTITILSVDSAKGQRCTGLMAQGPKGKSCWVTVKYLPNDKWHGITINGNTNDTTSIDYTILIYIIKDPIDKEAKFTFKFKDFVSLDTALVKLNTDTLIINEKKITNYYFINHTFPERVEEPTDIEKIIWTDSEGLTAYKNKNGSWWTKK